MPVPTGLYSRPTVSPKAVSELIQTRTVCVEFGVSGTCATRLTYVELGALGLTARTAFVPAVPDKVGPKTDTARINNPIRAAKMAAPGLILRNMYRSPPRLERKVGVS